MYNPPFPLLLDGYKLGHPRQYPEGTEFVDSNFTARGSRIQGVTHTVNFGLQYFLQRYLTEYADETFFSQPLDKILALWNRRVDGYLGPNNVGDDHIAALHDLGFMPLEFWALPEGTLTPLRMPFFTVRNTLPEFYWVTNSIETILSNVLWMPITSATTSWRYRKLLDSFTAFQGASEEFTQFQAHDFSMRGMSSPEAAMLSGAGHLLSFVGTDTVPAIDLIEQYYNGDGMIGVSVPATEHSVMCAGGETDERDTYDRLITEVYPEGIVSIVSDTWDYWNVITNIVPSLKDKILARNGKLVIRPDSGDPVKILCGDPDAPAGDPARKGTVQLLWETFGGTTTNKGFKTLDEHIGVIYGDSITFERAAAIGHGLEAKGFSIDNVVLGIGSYTFQYVTRDTFGMAMKATWAQINGEEHMLFKDPKTDNGVKKSAKGLITVNHDDVTGELVMHEGLNLVERARLLNDQSSAYKRVWSNGKFTDTGRQTFEQIRQRLTNG